MRKANCTCRPVPRPTVRLTVLTSEPNAPAAAAVYGWPGCSLLASVRLLDGSAFRKSKPPGELYRGVFDVAEAALACFDRVARGLQRRDQEVALLVRLRC